MLGVQIISVLFILIMLYTVRVHYRKGELPRVEAIGWSLGLIGLGIVVSFQSTADVIRRLFNVTRVSDVIVIFALMLVFTILIEQRIQLNKLRKKLETIIRDRAMGK